jgi:hypothetical protein
LRHVRQLGELDVDSAFLNDQLIPPLRTLTSAKAAAKRTSPPGQRFPRNNLVFHRRKLTKQAVAARVDRNCRYRNPVRRTITNATMLTAAPNIR